MGGATGGSNEADTLVFVNYRSSDGASSAELVYAEMVDRFGPEAVFLDHESLPLGRDFEPNLLTRLRGSAVLLVVVGDRWLDGEIGQRPIDSPDDWVRREILEALEHDIPVVPVLFPGASLDADRLPPELSGLTKHQYHEIHRRQRSDIGKLGERLIGQIPRLTERQANRLSIQQQRHSRRYRRFLSVGSVAAISVAVVMIYGSELFADDSPSRPPCDPNATELLQAARPQLRSDDVDERIQAVGDLRHLAGRCPSLHQQITVSLSAMIKERSLYDTANKSYPDDLKDRAPDVHAAMEVLGSGLSVDDGKIDLRGTDLRKAELPGKQLEDFDLTEARMDAHGNFAEASFQNSDLSRAHLDHADLTGSDLRGTTANGTLFVDIKLNGAEFDGRSDLSGACFKEADLTGAKGLHLAKLDGAVADSTTRWPAGFTASDHGVTKFEVGTCTDALTGR